MQLAPPTYSRDPYARYGWQPHPPGLTISTTRREYGMEMHVSSGDKEAETYVPYAATEEELQQCALACGQTLAIPGVGFVARLTDSMRRAIQLYAPRVAASVLLCLTLTHCVGFVAALPYLLQAGEGVAAASTLLRNEANCGLADLGDCTMPHFKITSGSGQ